MKWYSNYQHPKGLYFIIDEDLPAGFYLYVYSDLDSFKADQKDLLCPRHEQDYLQDTFDIIRLQAFEDFEVPLGSWVKAEE